MQQQRRRRRRRRFHGACTKQPLFRWCACARARGVIFRSRQRRQQRRRAHGRKQPGRSTSHAASTIRKDVVRRVFFPPSGFSQTIPSYFLLSSWRSDRFSRIHAFFFFFLPSLRCRSSFGSQAFLATITHIHKKSIEGDRCGARSWRPIR